MSGGAIDYDKLYEILEMEPGADFVAIKKQHRRLARKYHPDHRNGIETDRMARINDAVDLLELYWATAEVPPPSALREREQAEATAREEAKRLRREAEARARREAEEAERRRAEQERAREAELVREEALRRKRAPLVYPIHRKSAVRRWMEAANIRMGENLGGALVVGGIFASLIAVAIPLRLLFEATGIHGTRLAEDVGGPLFLALLVIEWIFIFGYFVAGDSIEDVHAERAPVESWSGVGQVRSGIEKHLEGYRFRGQSWVAGAASEDAIDFSTVQVWRLAFDYKLFGLFHCTYRVDLSVKVKEPEGLHNSMVCFWFDVEHSGPWLSPAARVLRETDAAIRKIVRGY